jgi:hypothetical protein
MHPRAWLWRKSLDEAKSGPRRTATDRLNRLLTGAQLAPECNWKMSFFPC